MGDRRKYWLGFSRVAGIGPARIRSLLDHFGDLGQAWQASLGELQAAGLPAKPLQALIQARQSLNLETELEQLDRAGYHLLCWDDSAYPQRLREITYPPPVLYLWGELSAKDQWAVAIVGTRAVTPYGRAMTEAIARPLAASGISIVSGLARGVDGIAHRTALEAGGRTLAVLGSGLDHIYPAEHRRLAGEIAGQGAILSDYPLGTRPDSGNFPPRNRIIAALSLAVIVVEAGETSGALITAAFGAEQGREVFAVPGNVTQPASMGANRLIRDGAHPLLSVDDVLEALDLEVAIRQESLQRRLPEDATERRLLESLSHEPIHIDALQDRVGLPASEIAASLALLELKGQVRQVGGMQYVLARESGPGYQVG